MKVKVAQSCPTLRPHGLYSPWTSPGQSTGVGSLFLFQGIYSTQGLNTRLPHCRQILYQLSYKGSPQWLSSMETSFSTTVIKSGLKLQNGSFADIFQIELKLTWLGRSGVQIFPLLHMYVDLTNCFLLILL